MSDEFAGEKSAIWFFGGCCFALLLFFLAAETGLIQAGSKDTTSTEAKAAAPIEDHVIGLGDVVNISSQHADVNDTTAIVVGVTTIGEGPENILYVRLLYSSNQYGRECRVLRGELTYVKHGISENLKPK